MQSKPARGQQHQYATGRALVSLLALSVGLASCGGSSSAPPGSPDPSDPGPPNTSPGQQAASQAAAAASATPAAPTPTAAAAPAPSPFHEYARFSAEVELHPLGEAALLSGQAKDRYLSFAFALLSATGELSLEERINRGLPESFSELHHVSGSWPGSAFASYITGNGRVGWSQAIELGKTSWKTQSPNPARWIDVGLSAWDRGRTLGLSFDSWGFDQKPPKFRVVGGAPKKPIPVLTSYPGPRPTDGSPGCTSLIVPEAFAATPTGHVFVVGSECGAEKQRKLEWFAPGTSKGSVLDSPLEAGEGLTAVAVSDTEIYLAAAGKLVLFDGAAFTPVNVEFHTRSLTQSKQGTLWASAGDSVWKKPTGAVWQRLSMPPGVEAQSIFAPDDDHVYVNSGKSLYSLGAPSAVKELELDWAQQPARSFKLPTAARPDCKQPYAMMYAFTKVTPDDYDFPLTRKAVKGQLWLDGTRFVVTEDNGKKYFGAFPTDYANGKKLVALIKKKVKGAIPALLCADPKVVRELPIDLRTGEVRP